MTRSEERLHVGTEKVVTGKMRLRKYVVTEMQTVTVPVTREEVRLERVPITEDDLDATSSLGPGTDEEPGIVLTAERVVVTKEPVPDERVRQVHHVRHGKARVDLFQVRLEHHAEQRFCRRNLATA